MKIVSMMFIAVINLMQSTVRCLKAYKNNPQYLFDDFAVFLLWFGIGAGIVFFLDWLGG